MKTTDEIPCFTDLNDWAFETHPEVFEAVRYLHLSSQYALFLSLWNKAGKPTEGF